MMLYTSISGGSFVSVAGRGKNSLSNAIYSETFILSRIHPGSSAKKDWEWGNLLGSWFRCPWQGRDGGTGKMGKRADLRCVLEIRLEELLQSG